MKTFVLFFFTGLLFIQVNAQSGADDVIFNLQYNVGGYNIHCHGDLMDINPIIIGANPPLTYTWYNDTGNVVSHSLNLTSVPVGLGRYTLEIVKGSWSNSWDLFLYEPDLLE
jgi:hypothetical protein